jgi:hypothetical protein
MAHRKLSSSSHNSEPNPNNHSIPNATNSTLERVKVRVYFVDGSWKTLAITEDTTFLQLIHMLCARLTLAQNHQEQISSNNSSCLSGDSKLTTDSSDSLSASHGSLRDEFSLGSTETSPFNPLFNTFAIFQVNDDPYHEKLMPDNAYPFDVMREWTGNQRFLFKKVLYFREKYDEEVKDRVLLPLLYKQAVAWLLACEWMHFLPPNATVTEYTAGGGGVAVVAQMSNTPPPSPSMMNVLMPPCDDDRPLRSPSPTLPLASSSAGALLKGPTPEQCVELAALQLFITYGIGDAGSSGSCTVQLSLSSSPLPVSGSVSAPTTHPSSVPPLLSPSSAPSSNSPSLLTGRHKHSNELPRCIPKFIYAHKKPSEWENLLLRYHQQHATAFKTLTTEQAMREYLTIVQHWVFYGTHFFSVCKSIDSKKQMSKAILGVNEDGIVVLRKEGERISLYPWSQLKSWSASLTSFTFETYPTGDSELPALFFAPKDTAAAATTTNSLSSTSNVAAVGPSSTTHEFETPEGETIAAIIQWYIDTLFDKIISLYA